MRKKLPEFLISRRLIFCAIDQVSWFEKYQGMEVFIHVRSAAGQNAFER